MSEHHHHKPHEGHHSGDKPARGGLHRGWFFWLAGFFLLLALLGFIFSGNLAFTPAVPATAAPPIAPAANK
jgi:hypothetical protein